ncbi:hypothetical protein HPB48_012031 [Haemaphysalis longicornis]|uniref:Glycoside hydrolase family 31 TIM barrel domain-containing protein n=1 Tax=Haemaphysalis longicornis TaxID=44386 RepID=A0A9J6GHU5_HAELO|nr:hypothetical protein HPB48_012031 [Haemaphysalis longicornis]
MDRQNDFTYDKEAYADLPDFVAKVHEGGRHYVMIFDPGVSGHEEPGTYPPLDDGLEMDVFIRNVTGGVVHAKVWNPVSTVFPDFTHPNSTEYWKKQFRDFYAVVPFDGAWIDMNEPYAFGGGANCPRDQRVERPPYVPGGEPLATETLCMSDKHYISPHYDVHNVYSQLEAKATYQDSANGNRVTSTGEAYHSSRHTLGHLDAKPEYWYRVSALVLPVLAGPLWRSARNALSSFRGPRLLVKVPGRATGRATSSPAGETCGSAFQVFRYSSNLLAGFVVGDFSLNTWT